MDYMKNGRIILEATMENLSPICVGSGRSDHSDRDVAVTEYPVDIEGNILPPEKTDEYDSFKSLPFIPATSLMGKICRLLDPTGEDKEIRKYWGESENSASFIDCSDLLLCELPSSAKSLSNNITEIRDGIRLNSATGTVAEGAKFDFEIIAAGGKFKFTMIFRVEEEGEENEKKATYSIASDLAWKVKDILENGITLGAKSTVGFGKMKSEVKLYELDFNDSEHFKHWIDNDLTFNAIPTKAKTNSPNVDFIIEGNFRIKNSMIIRSYSSDPSTPDTTHLKSGGRNILSGSSVKGALRGRAERILNTLGYNKEDFSSVFITGLFGDVEKEAGSKSKVKKDGYTVPSRIFVEEIPIDDDTVKEEIQTRIQIDRFTGGTVDGALIEEVPLFSVKDKVQVKHLRIRITNPTSSDKGLLLLLLKDLWTADLPIGGEKAIGRGVLEGINATILDEETQYNLPDVFKEPLQIEKLQGYVNSLNDKKDNKFYDDRVTKYKIRKNGK